MSRTLKSLLVLAVAALATVAQSASAQDKPKTGQNVGAPAADRVHVMGYQIVLLRADSKPSPPVEGVPPAVVKALKDVEAFLPFKGYHLLDSALILGESGGVTRMSGDGLIYVATVTASCGWFAQGCGATVTLTLPGETATKTASGGTSSSTVKEPVLRGAVELLSGEAVVVGASRVTADYGLVAVLTPLPRK
jgi:hypothetical protein